MCLKKYFLFNDNYKANDEKSSSVDLKSVNALGLSLLFKLEHSYVFGENSGGVSSLSR